MKTMTIRRAVSLALAAAVVLVMFAAFPSVSAHAVYVQVVVVGESGADVYKSPDKDSAKLASVRAGNSFLYKGSKKDADGRLWYNVHCYYDYNTRGWISAQNASLVSASSTEEERLTKYYRRFALAKGDFTLREGAGEEYPEVGTALAGDTYAVLGRGDDTRGITWFELQVGGGSAWARRTDVSVRTIAKELEELDYSDGSVPIIYLSPSRQPANLYAVGDTNECEQMTIVAQHLKSILEERYECVVYMADYDMPISKNDRPMQAYELGADIYLAIHSNATGGAGGGYGTQAYFFPGGRQCERFAQKLVDHISAIAPYANISEGIINGMKYLDGVGYGEVRDPGGFGMVSVLLEVEFHDKLDSAKWIIDHTREIAEAIADAMEETFGFKKLEANDCAPHIDKPQYAVKRLFSAAENCPASRI